MSDAPESELIVVTRKGDTVNVSLHTRLEVNDNCVLFGWKAQNEIFAELLQKRLNYLIDSTIAGIREAAYIQGWHDHKQKKLKKTGFYSYFANTGKSGV